MNPARSPSLTTDPKTRLLTAMEGLARVQQVGPRRWKACCPSHEDHDPSLSIAIGDKARVVGNQHPTQKPVEIFARPMRKHTRPGDVCFEPFSGSGSQLIAAEQQGRRCYAMELEPRFVDVAVARWEQFTGKRAERHVA